MISIRVLARDGSERTISTMPGNSLMQALRDHGFDEVLATCGGCCSCATCHIYVEQGPKGLDQFSSDDEDDLLDSSNNRQPNSRLACQIHLENSIENLSVRIAPED
jgi:ferredoxin